MSKRQQAGLPDMALSPYLSLRQTIRPAIFAQALLAREKEQAGALVDEANQILTVSRELLKATGFVHVRAPEPSEVMRSTSHLGAQDALLDSFADAAMLWTKIIGNCMALTENLLAQGRLDEVRTLAATLTDAGEVKVGNDLRERLANAAMARYKKRLAAVHPCMNPQEIEDAIETLASAFSEIPESHGRNVWLNSFLPALAGSVLKYTSKPTDPYSPNELVYTVEDIEGGGRMSHSNIAENSLADIAALFRAAATGH
jgi:hypothetical protein